MYFDKGKLERLDQRTINQELLGYFHPDIFTETMLPVNPNKTTGADLISAMKIYDITPRELLRGAHAAIRQCAQIYGELGIVVEKRNGRNIILEPGTGPYQITELLQVRQRHVEHLYDAVTGKRQLPSKKELQKRGEKKPFWPWRKLEANMRITASNKLFLNDVLWRPLQQIRTIHRNQQLSVYEDILRMRYSNDALSYDQTLRFINDLELKYPYLQK